MSRFSMIRILFIMGILVGMLASSAGLSTPLVLAQQKKQVTLRAELDDLGNVIKWDGLLQPAIHELNLRHPDMNIQINYTTTHYNQTRTHLLNALGNKTNIDLISIDQIWLGDFAQKGYLTDLTNYFKGWSRGSDWYQTNLYGGVYSSKLY